MVRSFKLASQLSDFRSTANTRNAIHETLDRSRLLRVSRRDRPNQLGKTSTFWPLRSPMILAWWIVTMAKARLAATATWLA